MMKKSDLYNEKDMNYGIAYLFGGGCYYRKEVTNQFFKYDNGIIKMNEVNIFDASKRSSIIIELEVKMI